MTSYTGVGVMSGSSLDGLDLCCVEFTGDVDFDIWSYRVKTTRIVPYTSEWREKLGSAASLSGLELVRLHYDYAHFMGRILQNFIADCDGKVDFVAIHGHTVFHQPDQQLTFQLGDGETLATYLTCPLVANFRAKDVALGGQGAPLVPSGERFLYSQMALCVNLGGIANVGMRGGGAWDICPCNIVMNKLARLYDSSLEYDRNGEIAEKGEVCQELLSSLESLEFYSLPHPKSLGNEWVESNIWPLLDTNKCSIPNIMRTFVEHITNRIADACSDTASTQRPATPTSPSSFSSSPTSPSSFSSSPNSSNCVDGARDEAVLITGGGAHNVFLMKKLREKLAEKDIRIHETDDCTVDFKEALVFAYLGLRSLLGLTNVFSETTGAKRDCVAGSIHQPTSLEQVKTNLHAHFRSLLRRQMSA